MSIKCTFKVLIKRREPVTVQRKQTQKNRALEIDLILEKLKDLASFLNVTAQTLDVSRAGKIAPSCPIG